MEASVRRLSMRPCSSYVPVAALRSVTVSGTHSIKPQFSVSGTTANLAACTREHFLGT